MRALVFVLLVGVLGACGDGGSMDQQSAQSGVMESNPMTSLDGVPMMTATPTMPPTGATGMMGTMGMMERSSGR